MSGLGGSYGDLRSLRMFSQMQSIANYRAVQEFELRIMQTKELVDALEAERTARKEPK